MRAERRLGRRSALPRGSTNQPATPRPKVRAVTSLRRSEVLIARAHRHSGWMRSRLRTGSTRSSESDRAMVLLTGSREQQPHPNRPRRLIA
jgi:hypothetical protein